MLPDAQQAPHYRFRLFDAESMCLLSNAALPSGSKGALLRDASIDLNMRRLYALYAVDESGVNTTFAVIDIASGCFDDHTTPEPSPSPTPTAPTPPTPSVQPTPTPATTAPITPEPTETHEPKPTAHIESSDDQGGVGRVGQVALICFGIAMIAVVGVLALLYFQRRQRKHVGYISIATDL
jgi:hypothetical protein